MNEKGEARHLEIKLTNRNSASKRLRKHIQYSFFVRIRGGKEYIVLTIMSRTINSSNVELECKKPI